MRFPELRLLLWLAPTGGDSEAYLRGLQRSTAGDRWIEVSTADYEQPQSTRCARPRS